MLDDDLIRRLAEKPRVKALLELLDTDIDAVLARQETDPDLLNDAFHWLTDNYYAD